MPLDYGNNSGTTVPKTTQTTTTKTLSFDEVVRIQLGDSRNEGDVEKFLENGALYLTATKQDDSITLSDFSQQNFNFLQYSNVVVLKEVPGGTLYFVIQLASTGPSHQSPADILKSVAYDAQRRKHTPLVMPGNAIEENLSAEIEETILAALGTGAQANHKTRMVGGLVIHASVDITDPATAAQALSEAVNVLQNTALIESGAYSEASLALTLAKRGTNKDVSYAARTENLVLLGDHRFTNFETKLTLVTPEHDEGINTRSGEMEIATTAGNVQLMVYKKDITVQTQQGLKPSSIFSYFPTITINAIDMLVPTTGSALIAIAQSAVLTQELRWVSVLAETVRVGKNPGVIGLLKNEEAQGKAELVDLTSRNFTIEQREEYIKTSVDDNPVMQLDIPIFGAGTGALNLFAIAADTNHPDCQDAREEILTVGDELTNGAFKDFNPNDIFIGSTRIPYGTFVDKDKNIRPLDEIDIMYMLDKKSGCSIDMIQSFIATEVGEANDLVRIQMLAELKQQVAITGYKERLVLNPEFTATLLSGLQRNGIYFNTEPSRVLGNTAYNFGITKNLYAAGTKASAAFATYGGQQQTGSFFGGYNTTRR